ncbi:helix-turn-helix domain-containing protein [Streptomyces rubellomurinus]|uniref:helix-turn-helix domain-containing protein n=1 Tax=Streptomyces rubellomurinus (strain ATCC 31215) TaxID=359131 RepID=UPI000696B1F6|nr:helix-turn-helix transcriptional regulator [Streptomyces rubellomurinus]
MPAHPDHPAQREPDGEDALRFEWAGPVGAAKLLGTILRKLREARHLRLSDAAPEIRASVSKLSRMERGESTPSARDVNDLIDLYDASPEDREDVRVLLERVKAGPFAPEYADITPGWFRRLIGLEGESARLEYWEGILVPGPFQTRDYAKAIIQAGRPRAPLHDIERRVHQRMDRKRLLHDDPRRQVVALLDESVLYRSIGGPEVMIDQLKHLQFLTELPTVNIRILPYTTRLTPPPMAFTRIRFQYTGPGDIVYVEGPVGGATYVSKSDEVERYADLIWMLHAHSVDREDVVKLIDKAVAVQHERSLSRKGGS